MRALHTGTFAALAALTLGCNAPDEGRDAGEAASEQRALAQVALTFTRAGEAAPRFEAVGHFVRYRATDSARVAVVLGLSDDEAIPVGTCRLVDAAEEVARAVTSSPDVVQLLDAGRLLVKGPTDATMLPPRHYPDLTPYVTGVVYGLGDVGAIALDPGGFYQVAGEGGDEVGPFTAQITAPREFPSLTVAPLKRGGDLELRWSEAADATEPLLVTVAWSSRGGAREVRCRVRDTGAFRVGHELLPLPALPSGTRSPDALYGAEVTATRLHRGALWAPGAGRGELTFGLREVLPLAVVE